MSTVETLLDRLNPIFSAVPSFRDIYMIATAAEDEETVFDKAYNGLQGWVDCFEKATLKGIVTGGGIEEKMRMMLQIMRKCCQKSL